MPYHNTLILSGPEFRQYYVAGWAGHAKGTQQRVLNNLFVHVASLPGLNFASADDNFQADGNLHWALKPIATFEPFGVCSFRG